VGQARPPAIMWVLKPMTRPDRRARPFIIPHPRRHPCGRAHRAGPGPCRSLLADLTTITDPRQRRGRRHTLGAVLAVAVCAVLAGARSLTVIGEWAADAPGPVLAALGVRRDLWTGAFRPPAEATVRRVLAASTATPSTVQSAPGWPASSHLHRPPVRHRQPGRRGGRSRHLAPSALSGRHGSATHSTNGPASAIPPLTCPVGLDRRCWSGSRWLA
jgi:DDE_Tnp_1-associated